MRWLPLVALVLAQISYPLVSGGARATVVIVTVVLGYIASVSHAFTTRGARVAAVLVAVTTLGGMAVEQLGIHTSVPFGAYSYADALGPSLFGVPMVVPLAWTWMAWPAWLVAGTLVRGGPLRVVTAGVGLASWDLFLDPQMVSEGYWRWSLNDRTSPGVWPLSGVTLPGVDDIPVGNYLGWLVVAITMMTALAASMPLTAHQVQHHADTPMISLYLWTYVSCVLAHAVFLGLPASAWWGGVGMGLVAIPLAVSLRRPRARPPAPTAPTSHAGTPW